jgi:hypothetical protein
MWRSGNGSCLQIDVKKGIAWVAIAVGAGLLLTILPSAWIVLMLGLGLVALGCRLLF